MNSADMKDMVDHRRLMSGLTLRCRNTRAQQIKNTVQDVADSLQSCQNTTVDQQNLRGLPQDAEYEGQIAVCKTQSSENLVGKLRQTSLKMKTSAKTLANA